MNRQTMNYANAEVRGQVRAWKTKLARNYAVFDTAYTQLSKAPMQLVGNMIRGSRATRQSAFDTIHKSFGPGVKLEKGSVERRGDRSVALWSILKPRDAVTVVAPTGASESERASLAQDCVTVDYVLVGTSLGLVCSGLWTLEVPDHALGRAVERSRLLHPETIIRDAHQNLLELPSDILNQRTSFTDRRIGAYIKAGAGCFHGYFSIGPDQSANDDLSVRVRVDTWLDDDQLHADQIVMSAKGEPGNLMGDTWLAPHPLKLIDETGPNLYQAGAWNPWTRK